MKKIISCGHELTALAAHETLKKGGNAFDALVSAAFSSFSTEPMLTSGAGVGAALLRFPDKEIKAVDFLADFPSRGKDPHIKAVKKVVSFGDETQAFYLGYGSLGVPGNLDGLLHIHKNYGELELKDVLHPAISCARGHKLNSLQALTFRILEAFCLYSKESMEIFAPRGRLLKEGEALRNRKFAGFLELLAEDKKGALRLYHKRIKETLKGKKSSLVFDDIKSYKVFEREPLSVEYSGNEINLFPPPSAGGPLIAYGLTLLEKEKPGKLKHNSAEHIRLLVKVMQACDKKRTEEFFRNLLGGTTHISIIDGKGNAVAATTSNGQGAGVMIEGTGIMLNNFAAEPDLIQYKKLYRARKRMTTMMSPTIISKDGKVNAVLGSGGSNRIRSAIMQAISNMIDFRMSSEKAANASRVHFEDNLLQLEYGIKKSVCNGLAKEYKTNVWSKKNLFFGGVHIATPQGGGGDKRRGGYVIVSR